MHHPWNSLLHNAVKSFIESELLSQRPSLMVDVVLNHNLPSFIAHSQKDSVGFLGQLRLLREVLESIRSQFGFISESSVY